MKWSLKAEWGAAPVTLGMWHPMQPVTGLTGQDVRSVESVCVRRRDLRWSGADPSGGAGRPRCGEWHSMQRAS